jgi:hypothetical protein
MNDNINDDLYEKVPASNIVENDQYQFIPINIEDLYQFEPFSESKKYNNNLYITIINFILTFLIIFIFFHILYK